MGMKIIAGDDVIVISGKDKGKMGKVIKVLKKKHCGKDVSFAIVSGVNVCRRVLRQLKKVMVVL